jgi:ubiquinone/menaquinone biosynthesis C-methylase UbiE
VVKDQKFRDYFEGLNPQFKFFEFLTTMLMSYIFESFLIRRCNSFLAMQTFSTDLPKIEEFVQLNGRDVLEVGCGDGRLSALLEDKVGSLTAIDPDKTVITLAKKNIARVDFKVGSGENLEFADRSFYR